MDVRAELTGLFWRRPGDVMIDGLIYAVVLLGLGGLFTVDFVR